VAFRFKITKVEKLPRAGVGVIDGTVLAGQVMTGQEVTLVHEGKRLTLRVAGVVMGAALGKLSLSFKLRQPAFEMAREGDELVSE
jgi:hypothetical protein